MFQPSTLLNHQARQQRRAKSGSKLLKPSPACIMQPSARTASADVRKIIADLGLSILQGKPKRATREERGMGKVLELVSRAYE